jgi:hypothetical protein
MRMHRLGGSGLITAFVVTFLLLCAGCGAPGSIPAVPAANPTGSPTGPAADQPTPEAGKVARPPDPKAPSTYRPVTRNGKKPNPTIKAARGGLSEGAVAKYSDGVWLRIDRVRHGTEQGQGPGAFPGRANTAVTLSLHNKSSRTIDLTQVVVTATYGSPARLASAVYEDSAARDFGTRVRPGGSASATYVFAIPADESGKVGITVDFDGVHVAASFAGAAR